MFIKNGIKWCEREIFEKFVWMSEMRLNVGNLGKNIYSKLILLRYLYYVLSIVLLL